MVELEALRKEKEILEISLRYCETRIAELEREDRLNTQLFSYGLVERGEFIAEGEYIILDYAGTWSFGEICRDAKAAKAQCWARGPVTRRVTYSFYPIGGFSSQGKNAVNSKAYLIHPSWQPLVQKFMAEWEKAVELEKTLFDKYCKLENWENGQLVKGPGYDEAFAAVEAHEELLTALSSRLVFNTPDELALALAAKE